MTDRPTTEMARGLATARAATARAAARRMPGEYAWHERTVICWPARAKTYPGELMVEARVAHAEVARAVARFEPVTVIANPGADAADAATRCGGSAEVVELPLDDSWFRDTGPTYVLDGGERIAVHWEFNAWGEKFTPYERDAALAGRWARHHGDPVERSAMVFEGGSLNVDGEGAGVTTTQCLLHPNRDPARTAADVEAELSARLGVERLLWLPYGLALDTDTDGHVDNVAAFAGPGRLILQGCNDPDEDDWLRMDVNRRAALGWRDARGEPLEVVALPVLPFVEHHGARECVPYLNFYIGNGFVAVPTCDHPADHDMLAILADQFPGREVIPLDVGPILAVGGGGIHCITQQVPALPGGRA
jgi:agmatine deiminase